MAKESKSKKPESTDDQNTEDTLEVTEDAVETTDEPEGTDEDTTVDLSASAVTLAHTDLHARLEKAFNGSKDSGDAHAVHLLNKAVMLTGSLKHSLPALIAVAGDDLKAGLQALLTLL